MHRTTVRLDEHLLAQAKEYASRNRRTLTSVIEDALRALVARAGGNNKTPSKKRRRRLPVSKQAGGPLPGVNLDRYGDLLDIMDECLPLDKRR